MMRGKCSSRLRHFSKAHQPPIIANISDEPLPRVSKNLAQSIFIAVRGIYCAMLPGRNSEMNRGAFYASAEFLRAGLGIFKGGFSWPLWLWPSALEPLPRFSHGLRHSSGGQRVSRTEE